MPVSARSNGLGDEHPGRVGGLPDALQVDPPGDLLHEVEDGGGGGGGGRGGEL